MRTLNSQLETAQQQGFVKPRPKITLSNNGTSYEYTTTRIIKIPESTQQPYNQYATILLNNSDGEFDSKDLKGFQCVISWGEVVADGTTKYSNDPPLWVMNQRYNSRPGDLVVELTCVGRPNRMAEDHASASYIPDSSDTDTVKDLIDAIAGATLACFNHCEAVTVDWDSEDDLIDSHQPKDSFRVYVNGSRLAALRRLIDRTKCVMRFRDDGHIHIFVPTTTGTTYDYQYELGGDHTIFKKAYREAFVIPNRVDVASQPDDSPSYSGSATDACNSILDHRQYERMKLASDAEGGKIATAILSKYQLHAQLGGATVPMNCGQEVFDYIQAIDKRGGDTRTGNIGTIKRIYDPENRDETKRYCLIFEFGGWLSVRQMASNLEVNPSGFGNEGQYFERLAVKDLYVENITADSIVLIDLDDIADGSTYQRIKATSLTAAGLVILDQVVEGTYSLTKTTSISGGEILLSKVIQSSSYRTVTDTQKGVWDGKPDDMDEIGEGSTYQRVLATQISAGKIELTSASYILNEDGVVAGTLGGTRVELLATGLRGYNDSTLQFELRASDGKAYFGAGAGIIDSSGLTLRGTDVLIIQHTDESLRAYIGASSTAFVISAANGIDVEIGCEDFLLQTVGDIDIHSLSGDVLIDATSGFSVRAGGTAPTAPGAGDVHIDADDLCQIRAGIGEAGNLLLTAGIEGSYGGIVHIRAYDSSSGMSAITLNGSGDIEIDPEGNDVIPGTSGTDDLGTGSDYWDNLHYKTLSDEGCPAPIFKDPVTALGNMRTKSRRITLSDAIGEAMGKRAIRRVKEAGGKLDIEEWDKSSFPKEIISVPTEEDIIKGRRVYERRLQQYEEGSRSRKPIYIEPHPAVITNELVWLLVRTNQELAHKVEALERRVV